MELRFASFVRAAIGGGLVGAIGGVACVFLIFPVPESVPDVITVLVVDLLVILGPLLHLKLPIDNNVDVLAQLILHEDILAFVEVFVE